jgi:hypothetical protein
MRKVYTNTVKKWAIGAGIAGIPLSILLIWYLVSLGSIVVTGYSEDVVCAGTEQNPCVAYINFTTKEDIFIYPNETWKQTAFYTEPQPKDVRMYRSWGKGWREINLSQKCTGTWCGLSNSKDNREFAFAFRANQSYQIKYVVLKNSPEDTLKWGFTKEVDPKFLGITRDNLFVALESSRGDLTSGEAIFTINNPIDNLSLSKYLSMQFTGDINVKKYELFILKNESKEVPAYTSNWVSKTCEEKDNETIETKEVDCSYYENVESGKKTIYLYNWVKQDNIPLGMNKIKIVGYWDASVGKRAVDWKPTIKFDQSMGLKEDLAVTQDSWAWWNVSWGKKSAINVQENSGGALTNYSVLMNISYLSSMAVDFSDLRFTNSSDNEELSYWIENETNSTYAMVWVKIPNMPASVNTTIYMYYNATVSSKSNVSATFLWGDDFDDGDVSDYALFIGTTSSCTLGSTATFTAQDWAGAKTGRTLVNGAPCDLGVYKNDSPVISVANTTRFRARAIEDYCGSYNATCANSAGNTMGIGNYTNFTEFLSYGTVATEIGYHVWGIMDKNITDIWPTANKHPMMTATVWPSEVYVYWDYLLIRKYAVQEPIYYLGSEEGLIIITEDKIVSGTTYNTTENISYGINTTFKELNNMSLSLNGTVYSFLDYTLKLFWNLDNRSNIPCKNGYENDTCVADLSLYKNNGTATRMNTTYGSYWISNGKHNGAFTWDGKNDTVGGWELIKSQATPVNNDTNWTFFVWVNYYGNIMAGGSKRIMRLYGYTGWLTYGATTGTCSYDVYYKNLTGSSKTANSGSYACPLNQWHQIGGTYTQLNETHFNITLYVNGILRTSTLVQGNFTISSSGIQVGGASDYPSVSYLMMNGSMDDIMIWNRSLNPDEIKKLYNWQATKYSPTSWQVNQTIDTSYYNQPYFLCTTDTLGTTVCSPTRNILYGGSCVYSSGNWAVNCADYCNISSNVAASSGVNNLTIIGTGQFKMTANITGFKNIMTYGNGGTCNVTCIGGCFI